jgi:hypothetical protein
VDDGDRPAEVHLLLERLDRPRAEVGDAQAIVLEKEGPGASLGNLSVGLQVDPCETILEIFLGAGVVPGEMPMVIAPTNPFTSGSSPAASRPA